VEICENEKPMFVERRELAEDTAGPGKTRGGTGLHFVVRSEAGAPITVGLRADRIQHPAQGLFGGGEAAPGIVQLNGNPQHPKRTIILGPGDVLTFRTPGGGGYGDPRQRDRARVREDVAAGLVSAERALTDYGFSVD